MGKVCDSDELLDLSPPAQGDTYAYVDDDVPSEWRQLQFLYGKCMHALMAKVNPRGMAVRCGVF